MDKSTTPQPNPQPTPQPVAYDNAGRPLYYHPPQPSRSQSAVTAKPEVQEGHNFDPRIRTQYSIEPDFAHTTRPYEPQQTGISDRLQRKHAESAQKYPKLNLSQGEFVMLQIRRHPIGLYIPAATTILTLIILMVLSFVLPGYYGDSASSGLAVAGILVLLMLLVAGFGAINIWVYTRNRFLLTNESVIQEIQHNLFSHHEQTVSLGSIEDASYKQQGVIQYIFNYGTIRLSTEGEETTYRFAFVENPKKQIALVNNAVEAFKNGRPVGEDHLDS